MKRTLLIPIALIAISLLLGMNAVVADEIERTTDEVPIDHGAQNGEECIEEPLIAPYMNIDGTTVDAEYDDVVGEDLPQDTPHILDNVSNGDYDLDVAFGAEIGLKESNKNHGDSNIGIPMMATIGLAGLIVLGLLFVKRR